MDCQALLVSFQRFKQLCLRSHETFLLRKCDSFHDSIEMEIETIDEEVEYIQNDVTQTEEVNVGFLKYEELEEEEQPIESPEPFPEQEEFQYECDLCQKRCKTKQGITSHIEKLHLKIFKLGSRETFICTYELCKRKFFCKIKYDGHIRAHEGKNPYQCDVCGAVLATSRNLKRHKLTHITERNFKCSFCDARFVTQETLSSHEKFVHKTGRQYVCSFCAYTCYNPTAMNVSIYFK